MMRCRREAGKMYYVKQFHQRSRRVCVSDCIGYLTSHMLNISIDTVSHEHKLG